MGRAAPRDRQTFSHFLSPINRKGEACLSPLVQVSAEKTPRTSDQLVTRWSRFRSRSICRASVVSELTLRS